MKSPCTTPESPRIPNPSARTTLQAAVEAAPALSRKRFLQASAATLAAALIPAQAARAAAAASALPLGAAWDKTFPKSAKVEHRKVSFTNRYGIVLAADLYLPAARGNARLAALALAGPFGAVKEQVSGRYAQTLAERGFATLAFDPSYTGESAGTPRHLPSPEINTEDFSAAVDFLGLQPFVSRERIGIVGICGFGGMGLAAAAVDKRIKAVVTTSLYDMSRLMARGYNDAMTRAARTTALEQMSLQRWADAETGAPAAGPRILPETLDGVTDPVVRMYFDYYRTPRGFHPRSPGSNGAWTATGPLPFMNLPLLTYVDEIAPRPILLVVGEKAHSRYFSEDVLKAAARPKELLVIPGAIHTDLYDRMEVIPFDRIAGFFEANLKSTGSSGA